MLTAMSRHTSSTVLPLAKASSAARSFLIVFSGVCLYLYMEAVGAHALRLSSLIEKSLASIPDYERGFCPPYADE